MKRKRAREQAQAATPPPAAASTRAPARTVTAAPSSAPASTPTQTAASPATAPLPASDRIDALTQAIGGELGRPRGEVRGRDADLVDALQRVAASYDRMADQLDHARKVQALLAEALIRIDRRLAAIEGGREGGREVARPKREELPRAPRVIGGSIAPRQDIPRVDH